MTDNNTETDLQNVTQERGDDVRLEQAELPTEKMPDIEPSVEIDKKDQPLERPAAVDPESSLIVVGVGASAGGLEALQSMVSNLPPDIKMSFIVAQHLSPSYRSMMVDLLEKDSTLAICAAKDGDILRAGQIYICPPNHNIELYPGDTIKLTSYPDVRYKPRPSVDMLFESIALVKGEHAIGIVLSGTGSDGARGIRAIKGENGLGIVQEPSSAKYDGMPNAAINSSNVDLIIPATQIGDELLNYMMFRQNRAIDSEQSMARETYNGIIRLLKKHCDVDFGLYKENTILRRIERRMTTLKIRKAEEYLKYLNKNLDEVTFLFQDMLIGVTSFFRDGRAFEQLNTELKHYVHNKKEKVLRVWSVGCSTGEEAYSLSMMISEILGDKIVDYKIQIFATDIDKQAIDYARNGVYPEVAIQNLPRYMKEKYLLVKGDQYEVIKQIKAMVIFSIHDVNSDPPFLRLDLITCRNLMIYFTVELQRQIFPTFHYALNPKGLMMLGQSESIGVFQEQFRPLVKSGKIYESVYIGKKLPPERNNKRRPPLADYVDLVEHPPSRQTGATKKLDDQFVELIIERLQQLVLPHAILINENHDIIFTEGQNPLLVRPQGLPTNNIFRNMHPQLTVELRSALHSLECGKEKADTGFHALVIDGEDVWVKLLLIRIVKENPLGNLTLIFSQIEDPMNIPMVNQEGDLANEAMVQEQQRLLVKTKEQLQDVIEELETSNEEMQSMNEELQSSNEELQSSNEELETTNEELQSTNEELQTAYSELRVAYEDKEQQQAELLQLRNELEQSNSLLEEAERIGRTGSWLWEVSSRKFTWSRGCYRIFGLDERVFHPSFEAFIGLAHADDRNRLEEHLKGLLQNKVKQPFVFKSPVGETGLKVISLEALVSFNDLKQAVKVMGSMTDITEKVVYERNNSEHKDKINFILNSSMNAAYIYDVHDQQLAFINPRFTQLLGYSQDDLDEINTDDFLKLCHSADRKQLQALFTQFQSSAKAGQTYPLTYRLKLKGTKKFLKIHANHAIYEMSEITGMAKQILVTFFAAENVES
ncbi:CheR family methyltransferase [Pontibacter sp. JAM-7]|uniref:CheR family methyltransferase n=1 Tax=Pontibacter sp. JAM-7 TaxID=3366581 RepID=UPI003AF8A0B2